MAAADSIKVISAAAASIKVKMLLHFFLLLSSASSLSQTGRDEQTLAGESNTCDKSIAVNSDTCHKIISGDSDKSEEGQHKVVDSCHRRENDVDAEEEKTVLGSSSMEEEEKKMEWKEFDWAAYQALDINPADQEEPTARSTTTSLESHTVGWWVGEPDYTSTRFYMHLLHLQVCLGRAGKLPTCSEPKCAGLARSRL